MEFVKCSIARTAYGRGITDVERAMAKRKGSPIAVEMINGHDQTEDVVDMRPHIKGFNFKDEGIMNGNWVNERNSERIQKFLQLLAICHTVIPEVDEETGKVSYEAESPDEAAFVVAAKELGFEFYRRTQTAVSLYELDPVSRKKVDRYKCFIFYLLDLVLVPI
ncbi:putative phospholipid-transporting ATPase 12 [Drosera capensis]